MNIEITPPSSNSEGVIRLLSAHVANKIAAGEVVERPASVVKELVENALDAKASHIAIHIVSGGSKLISVRDDGCGMAPEDAHRCLERQATSKIREVEDLTTLTTLGFRGEAIPSIASVSRFTLTTRRHNSDEGTRLVLQAGTLVEASSAGCPPGTCVEVKDLFCNVPARRKFLRAALTEEAHVRQVFTSHALAYPTIGFSLTVNGREICHLAPAANLTERVRELFGPDFLAATLPLTFEGSSGVRLSGFLERPNRTHPSRREQYIFVNHRPATSPIIQYALREAYPRQPGEVRPAVLLFLELPPQEVDVNVHPTKREVRFRNPAIIKNALFQAIDAALKTSLQSSPLTTSSSPLNPLANDAPTPSFTHQAASPDLSPQTVAHTPSPREDLTATPYLPPPPEPLQVEFSITSTDETSRPWTWFRYLAQTSTGFLLLETDRGLLTVNPRAAAARIAFEKLRNRQGALAAHSIPPAQELLLPEIVQLSPPEFAHITAALEALRTLGFRLEPFGRDTFKVEALPQIVSSLSATTLISTIAYDLAEAGAKRGSERWLEEWIAKTLAHAFASTTQNLSPETATQLIEELAACQMPYVSPRGKPTMIFTSTNELRHKFRLD